MPRAPAPDPNLARVLRQHRIDRGLTQETLAFHAGITTGSLGRIELAQTSPAWATVRQIADALGVTMEELSREVERKH
jgi:transcriptional regulator with XRE-family HTH domain